MSTCAGFLSISATEPAVQALAGERKTEFLLPSRAVDTHVHIFDPSGHPYAATRSYSPSAAVLSELLDFTSRFTRNGLPSTVVLVQPSPYGTDNRLLCQSLEMCHRQGLPLARGIAVIDPATTPDSELQQLHQYGNTESSGRQMTTTAICDVIRKTADRIRHLPGWWIQVYVHARVWKEQFNVFSNLPVPIIADHLGGLKGASILLDRTQMSPQMYPQALSQPGFDELIQLAQAGKVVVKLSGVYRASRLTKEGFGDLEPIIRALVLACSSQLIYGSDWPHTGEGKDRVGRSMTQVEPFRVINHAEVLLGLRRWVGSAGLWRRIMVDNPRRVYGIA
ncbi:hypothetical protein EHS25_007944 [Saitozyma podzolica]|uniref:Amidohydrolase-related domain-containing protein n=1 Tax=Saitozyma podzolica TaxID=1890683 RepID=A0A427YRC7_9TREE|nr:hypothetical protein EHS25_007944 [Saitozyma podzolica]